MYETTSNSSPASVSARSSAWSKFAVTISWPGAPRSRSRPASSASTRCTCRRLVLAGEEPVELVVERADPLHQRDVLRHAGEVGLALRRVAERLGEAGGDLGVGRQAAVGLRCLVDPAPEHEDEATREERLEDVAVVVLRLRRRHARSSTCSCRRIDA